MIFVLISWCETRGNGPKPVELYGCEERGALSPLHAGRSRCAMATGAVPPCAGVRVRSTAGLYHIRVVNVKLAVHCCYKSHTSVVNVNGVCNTVKMDTFSFQM